MPKINEYININNKKPVEIVQEIKDEYQIPSFEEFMKSYENDGSLNYADLEHSDVGDGKRCGPMPIDYCERDENGTIRCYERVKCRTSYGGRVYEHQYRFFVLLEAEWGADGQWFFGIPTYRSPKRSIDPMNEEARRFISSVSENDYEMSGIWQDGRMRWKIVLERVEQAEKMLRYFANGGLKVRGRGNVHHRGAENVVINTLRTALETYRNGGNVNLTGREF